MRRFLILFILLMFTVGVAGLVLWNHFGQFLEPVSERGADVVVEIPKGSSVAQIGRILEEKGLVRSADAFRFYVKYKKVGPQLKAGEHLLNPNLSLPEIVDSLVKGRFKLYKLTIPEGLTMKEAAARAAEAGLANEEEFLALCHDKEFMASLSIEQESLEGYLFPETYYFGRSTTTKKVVKTMVEEFLKVWKKYEDQSVGQDLTRHQVVTLASIIEKETGAAEERPLIAAVFFNRLKKGMRLETDPTVIYGINDFDGNLTRKHLQTPHPYNTYVITGLPPGPIANPGEASIAAVFHPAEVEYLFFVSKNDGTHKFSKSLSEHNAAVNQYQRRKNK